MTSPDTIFAQRLFYTSVESDHQFGRLLDMLQSVRSAVDDVWIFTENDGQDFRFIPLPEVRRRATIMAKRIHSFREAGFGASINVLNTIGHSDYAEPFLDPLPWSGIVGPDNQVSTCCSCPREPDFRSYVAAKYEAYAQCRPDRIWIDDDVRLFAHFWKVMHGCFCERCVGEFSRRTGRNWDREELYQAIVRDTYPAINPDRAAWMGYLSRQIVEIHQLIRETVSKVDPEIRLGGMNTGFNWCSAYYSQFQDRFEALRATGNQVIGARPGGGAFSDDRPTEAFQKAWSVAFQNTQYPPKTLRYAEVENYPFQFFEKSVASTAREASLYLAAGSDGITFDISGNLGNDPREHLPYFSAIVQRRPYLETIRGVLAPASAVGLNIAFNPEHAAWVSSDGKSLQSTDASDFFQACGWGFLGIPLRFTHESEGPSLLHGQLARGLPYETLEAILKKSVVMDSEALAHLWAIGLGPLTGVKVKDQYSTGTFERFTDHPLNEGFENYTREVSQGYYPATAFTLEAEVSHVQSLSKLYDYRQNELGSCSMAMETSSGSRIVVLGYRPWDYVGLPGKSAQCRRIVDWLHGAAATFRLAQGGKSVLFAYAVAGGGSACFYNASEDVLVSPTFQGIPPSQAVAIGYPDQTRLSITASVIGEITLPDLPAWGECFLKW